MTVAFIVKGYPRLSETFIAQEIHGLEQRGIDIALFSLRRPTDKAFHPLIQEIQAPVAYLPEYLHGLGVISPGTPFDQVRANARLHPFGPISEDSIAFSRRLRAGVPPASP